MPRFSFKRYRKRRPRYKRKRRTFRHRRRRRKLRPSLRRMGKASTDAMMVKLLWQQEHFPPDDITSPIFQIRLNSVFDPAVGGPVDSQPIGYDQWKQLYRNYQVFGCQLMLTCNNNSDAAGYNIAVYPSTQSIVKPTYNTCATTKYATTRYVGTLDSGKSRVIIKKYMNVQKIFGRQTFDLDWQSLIDDNPSQIIFWNIRATDTNFVNAPLDTQWLFRITYFVRFFNRIEVGEIPAPP